jgi:hypothetical protein
MLAISMTLYHYAAETLKEVLYKHKAKNVGRNGAMKAFGNQKRTNGDPLV